MAKKATAANMFSFEDIVSTMQKIIKPTSIQHITEETAKQRGFISTGIYVLNAAFSGDIFGGIADNRISVLGGESGVGKSFLCYNICREAQAAGYCVVYVDTEFSIELDQLPGYGIDISPKKFMLLSNNIIEDLKISMTQLLDALKEQKKSGKDVAKFLFVLDSVGQLGSRKEVEDAKAGNEKADFTKAKALASFFRIIGADLGVLGIPSIFTNHTYKCLTAGHTLQLADGTTKKIENIVIGDIVNTLDGPKDVIDAVKYDNCDIIKIELENGEILRCTSEHRFLVKPEWVNDENDSCWKMAKELTDTDIILSV